VDPLTAHKSSKFGFGKLCGLNYPVNQAAGIQIRNGSAVISLPDPASASKTGVIWFFMKGLESNDQVVLRPFR
jgi:hypothetical protein